MAEISQQELLQALHADNPPTVIDVRTRFEYDEGHIEGAVRIPFSGVLWHTGRLPADRNHPLVLTCEHGPRAFIAKWLLRLLGYRRLLYLSGHMAAWKQEQRPTVS